ncbi:very short patch repair endonuclease [Candidatus Omnitrophota bacterium]
MVDILSKDKRSWNMSRIRDKNTKPELAVRSFLHQNGFRFRIHKRSLPGKPDIVLPRYKLVIFVHGCFWHRHKGCKGATVPKTRVSFWQKKFVDNIKRFGKVKARLKKSGWGNLVIWECEIANKRKLSKILSTLKQSRRAK